MNVFMFIKQKFCKHKYRKHFSKEHNRYEFRCVKCDKIAPAQEEVRTCKKSK